MKLPRPPRRIATWAACVCALAAFVTGASVAAIGQDSGIEVGVRPIPAACADALLAADVLASSVASGIAEQSAAETVSELVARCEQAGTP